MSMRLKVEKQDIAMHAMLDATSALDEKGWMYRVLSNSQIKIGRINYWPSSGTITVDGELKKRSMSGLDEFLRLLDDVGDRRSYRL